MRRGYSQWYPQVSIVESVKGWNSTFFYCKDIKAPGQAYGMPPFVDIAGVPNDTWTEKLVEVLPEDVNLIKRLITKLTFGSPKLTGEDTILCWVTRRIQPLQHQAQLLCEYTGEVNDPQHTC